MAKGRRFVTKKLHATQLLAALPLLALLFVACGSSETEDASDAVAPAAAVDPAPAGEEEQEEIYLEYDEVNSKDYIVSKADLVLGEENLPGSFWGDTRQSPFSPQTGKVHPFPEFVEIASWINTEPLTLESLKVNVVLVEFWTYSCINCVWNIPHVKGWYDKYTDQGLVIVAVHSPEMRAEKKREKVLAAVAEHGIEYPVAQDNDFATWRAFGTVAWPTLHLVDKDGNIRYSHFGSGGYDETEMKIMELLAELDV